MQTNQIIEDLISKINSDLGISQSYEAIQAFDKKVNDLPIKKTYIAFSTNENAVSYFEDDNKECCRRTKVEIKAVFYAPPNVDTLDTYTLAETLLDYLIIEYAGKMTGYKIYDVEVSDDLKAFKLPCRISFVYEQCPAYNVEGVAYKPFADFMCKTHVVDTDIHVSAKEKRYWLEPFITGMYTGDGEAMQEIDIGFKPKFVVLFGSATAGVGYEGNEYTSYLGFSIGGKGTKGLEIKSYGFNVKLGDTVAAKGTHPRLNILGQTYNYIAFK